MIKELIAAIIGVAALYMTKHLGVYPIILMMVIIEFLSVGKNHKVTSISFIVGMLLSEAYFLYTGASMISLEYFIYVGFYLFVRHKGKEWFVDNNVNEYLYLLFTVSVPIFLDFITQLMEIELGILLFVTLYLVFLRMTDWILHSKLSVLIFTIIQVMSAFTLDSFVLENDLKIYFVFGMIIWTIIKWKAGRNFNVSRLFVTNVFRKSSKGVY